MSEQGAKNMFLWTAEKASSQKFYEKLKGQQTILRKETPEGDFHLQLISYVFDLPLELQPEF